MKVTFGAETDVGKVRERNEDNFLIDKRLKVFVVCDGMGGHAAGGVASATAVNVVRETILAEADLLKRVREGEPGVDRHDVLRMLERTVQRACYRIYERGQLNPAERGMGTTLTLLLLCGRRAYLAHVGDSRTYLCRDGLLHQLTEDHSLIADMVKHGRIKSPADVDERFRNAVTRAVGVHETVDVDTHDLMILPGDRFMLCSDGLTGYADLATLQKVVNSSKDDSEVCKTLVALANSRGGSDNITTVMVTICEVPETSAERVRSVLDTLRSLTLFKYLSYAELLRVANITEERRYPAGHVLFRQAEPAHEAYVILEGRVQIASTNVVIALLEPGRHFGEMALVDNEPRSADATTTSDCWLLALPRARFYELLRQNPLLAVKLLWSFIKAMTIRLRLTTSELSLVKRLFHAVSPDDVQRLPTEWLPPDDLVETPVHPRPDSGVTEEDIVAVEPVLPTDAPLRTTTDRIEDRDRPATPAAKDESTDLVLRPADFSAFEDEESEAQEASEE